MDIEKLAEITAQEFARVGEQFQKVDEQFQKVDEQFQKVDERFQGVEQRLDRLEAGQARLETGMKAVLEAVIEIPTKKIFHQLVHKVEDIDERVTVVERKLHTTSPRG